MFFLPRIIFQDSLVLERDLIRVVRFLVCVKWYQSFSYFLMIAGDDDGLKGLAIRIDIVEGKIRVLESTLDVVVQELKRLPLKIDDQGLTDGTYRSRRD